MEGLLTNNLLSKSDIFNKSGGSNIKSIQRGTLALSVNPKNITISGVDLDKTILKFKTHMASRNNIILSAAVIKGRLTSPTNIEFRVYNASSDTPYEEISWEVVEFNNVKSVQRGNTTYASTSIDVPISSVDISKSMAFISSYVNKSTNYYGQAIADIELLDATTLRLKAENTSVTSQWQVIEFK